MKDYQYTTIEKLIRVALGDEGQPRNSLLWEQGHAKTIGNVRIQEVTPAFNAWHRGSYSAIGISLTIEGYTNPVIHSGRQSITRRVMLKEGKLDLDAFRQKYAEVIEAWKPHQAAIEARTEELEAEARVKAQNDRYIIAGPDLLKALETAWHLIGRMNGIWPWSDDDAEEMTTRMSEWQAKTSPIIKKARGES